ncbi:uncharacterized protein DFL_001188 [Arthrobotrys flagrans]|uniref:BTB domain-containing protein n=1 Tax=Arthrobotrys flagrans TaxID=97331 RepID=A0A437AGE3_ARTFL|nr:hypothetical protein DFL_001188 [Arthrobotrys flagrans]
MVRGHLNYNHQPHSCETYDEELKSFESGKVKLEAENRDLESKNRELESKNRELESDRLKSGADKLSARKFPSIFDSETITILVGCEYKNFTIHVDTICTASASFKEFFSNRTENDEKKPVILDGEVDNVDAFEMFVEYCYLDTYFDSKYSESHLLLLHARVYALAEKLKCFSLKDLALRKATDWCYGHSMQKGNVNSKFQDIHPDILDAIRIIYTYTIDLNSGHLPSSVSKADDCEETAIVRDGFRLLLAHLAAVYLVDLRMANTFVEMHHAFPDFNTDMLLFMNDGSKSPCENMETPLKRAPDSTVQTNREQETIHLQRKSVLAFSSLFGTDTFTVFAGENAKRFDVHTAAIECSDYFRRLAASNMKEAREKTVHLNSEVDSAEAFDMFVQYCYFRDYFCDENRVDNLMHHVKAYLLADKLGCLGLKDLAFQKANLLCDAAYSSRPDELFIIIPTAVAMIYENTYDIHGGKIPRTDGTSSDDAVGEPSGVEEVAVSEGHEEKRGESEIKKETAPVSAEKDRDRFRPLLARFATAYLSKLREQKSFLATHHAFPDFATDVMLLATRGEEIDKLNWIRAVNKSL